MVARDLAVVFASGKFEIHALQDRARFVVEFKVSPSGYFNESVVVDRDTIEAACQILANAHVAATEAVELWKSRLGKKRK